MSGTVSRPVNTTRVTALSDSTKAIEDIDERKYEAIVNVAQRVEFPHGKPFMVA